MDTYQDRKPLNVKTVKNTKPVTRVKKTPLNLKYSYVKCEKGVKNVKSNQLFGVTVAGSFSECMYFDVIFLH